MISTIDEYLSQLRKELAGCDRATIQDALSDAEEYLRDSLHIAQTARPGTSEAEALPPIIEKYGLPDEIAAAYKDTESRITPSLAPAKVKQERSAPGTFFGVVLDPRAWGALFYLLFSLITGIFYFTWVVTGVSLSFGLLILIIGIPFAGLFILSVRGLSLIEGRVVEALLGVRMPRRPLFSGKNVSLWQRFKTLISDRYTWLSMVYMLLQMPLGIVYFTVFITLIATSLSLVASPILWLVFDHPAAIDTLHLTAGWLMPFTVLAGVLMFFLTVHLARLTGQVHGKWAKMMLVRD